MDSYIMKFLDKNIVGLSYEEEISLAKSVMNALKQKFIDEDFEKFLTELFFKKAERGAPINITELDYILGKYEFYKFTFPILEEDGTYIGSSEIKNFQKFGKFDKEGFSYRIAKQVSYAWYEMWKLDERFQNCAGIFAYFPDFNKDDPDGIKAKEKNLEKLRIQIREEFNQEVTRIIAEHDFDIDEAIMWVSEYIPNPDSPDFGFD